MKERLKVLFLFEDLCFGGTQKQNMELALRLNRERYDVSLLTLTGPTDMDAACKNMNLLHMGKDRKVPPLFFLQLRKYLAELKPDILVPCTALPNIWGRIWGTILQTPVIVGTCRGGGAPGRQHERILWRLAHHIVCNSEASLRAMIARGAKNDRLTYIGNGIDTDLYKPAEKEQGRHPLLLCVARLARDKDHQTLLAAFAQAWQKRPDLRLRLVGDGPEETALKEFAATRMPEEAALNIEFAGPSANPLQHYQEADIFALSSEKEGQPNVVMEAMSCGLPVCATSVGGIPGLVDDGATGFLCPAANAGALAANILKTLEFPEMAKKMGQKARKKIVDNFSFERMVAGHEKLFERLWEKHGEKK